MAIFEWIRFALGLSLGAGIALLALRLLYRKHGRPAWWGEPRAGVKVLLGFLIGALLILPGYMIEPSGTDFIVWLFSVFFLIAALAILLQLMAAEKKPSR